MSAIDAHDAGAISLSQWIPDLVPEAEPGAATPSGHPLLETPLTTALRIGSGCSSLQLPLFINKSSAASSLQGLSSYPLPDHNTCNSSLPPHANCLPLFYTFYFSPSASRSSLTPSLWSSDLSGSSKATHRIMPAPTFDASDDQLLLPITTDCFATSAACASGDTVGFRPHSSGSGRSERTASPLIFGRWARRHYQQHHDYTVSQPNGQETRKFKASSRKNSPKRTGRSRSNSLQNQQAQDGAVPQMTREEFEALPLAIQRKVCLRPLKLLSSSPKRSTVAAMGPSHPRARARVCSTARLGKEQTAQEPTSPSATIGSPCKRRVLHLDSHRSQPMGAECSWRWHIEHRLNAYRTSPPLGKALSNCCKMVEHCQSGHPPHLPERPSGGLRVLLRFGATRNGVDGLVLHSKRAHRFGLKLLVILVRVAAKRLIRPGLLLWFLHQAVVRWQPSQKQEHRFSSPVSPEARACQSPGAIAAPLQAF